MNIISKCYVYWICGYFLVDLSSEKLYIYTLENVYTLTAWKSLRCDLTSSLFLLILTIVK